MLKTILSITGRPGLYKLVSSGKNMIIVESVSEDKKRFPVYASEKVISLSDIAMYTDETEVPLGKVLQTMLEKEKGDRVSLEVKKASGDQLRGYLAEILPNFDRERVYTGDIKKLITWYNLLIANGITDFEEPEAKAEEASEAPSEASPAAE